MPRHQPNGKSPIPFQSRHQSFGSDPLERIVPFNIEAEEATLGSLLMDSRAIVKIASFLRSDDFYREKNKWVYEAVMALHARREAIDFLTVRDELERQGRLEEAGGASFLTSLINTVPTSIHIEHYAHIVERCSVRRRMIGAASAIATYAYEEDEPVEDSIRKGQQAFTDAVNRQTTGVVTAQEVLTQMWQDLERSTSSLNTGYRDLDRLTTGLRPGKLYVIGGRPGMGKSALMLNIAHHLLLQETPVLVVSLEMENSEVIQRIEAVHTQLDLTSIASGNLLPDDMHTLVKAEALIERWPLHIASGGSLNIDKASAVAAVSHARTPFGLIIVDYLQLMAQGSQNRVAEVGEVSRGLKRLALDLHVPVLAASSLSRATEARHDRRPMLSDLRESGDIESDADQVWLLYRPKYYDESLDDNTVEVIVAKHRAGPTGTIKLYYRAECTSFHSLAVNV